MKKNKWFIMAALVGLVLSVSFVVVGCSLFTKRDCTKSCSGMNCSGADFSGACNGLNLSGMKCN